MKLKIRKQKYLCKTCFSEILDYYIRPRKYCGRECFYKRTEHWSKGIPRTKETIIKIRNTMKKLGILPPITPKGVHRSPATEFKKGRKLSFNKKEEQRKLAKEKGFGKWMKGRIPDFMIQGKHYHPSRENHPNWKGGISSINSSIRHSEEYKKWRRDVFVRDQFSCQKCGHRFIKIVAHHIKSFSDYKELRFDVDNGQTLCRSCHISIHKPRRLYNKKS